MAEVAVKGDRRLNKQELANLREACLGTRSPGIARLAPAIGRSTGFLSQALKGKTLASLRLSDRQKLMAVIAEYQQEQGR